MMSIWCADCGRLVWAYYIMKDYRKVCGKCFDEIKDTEKAKKTSTEKAKVDKPKL